jgi:hypothetical protein
MRWVTIWDSCRILNIVTTSEGSLTSDLRSSNLEDFRIFIKFMTDLR